MNDILMEDNKIFNEENYKFKPPARDPEQFKANDPNANANAPRPQTKRTNPENKENGQNNNNFDPNQAAPQRRSQYYGNRPKPEQNRQQKKDFTFYAHPDVHFCEKRCRDEFPEDVEIRKDTLHVFGVDFFSEAEINNFFKDFTPSKIEWINDSSCNVTFVDAENCANAIFSLTTQIEENSHELDWRKG